MQIFRDLAGYSLGRADIVRRAMSKKKHDVLQKEREIFLHGLTKDDGTIEVEGCLRRGVDEPTANALFEEIQDFASYAFNKSHAAAYAVLAYQTAYLKRHYPMEYMASLLSSVLGNAGKAAEYMEECKRLQIAVLPPHVNASYAGFTVEDGGIRFGLLAVKNLGRNVIARLVDERRTGGKFTSFYNFCKRMSGRELNTRAIESLVFSGSLDHLGGNRRQMLFSMGSFLDSIEDDRRRNLDGQMGFFDTGMIDDGGEPPLIPCPDFPSDELLNKEKEVTGMYLSGHPMGDYEPWFASGAYAKIDAVLRSAAGESTEYQDNLRVTLLCMVMQQRRKITKNGGTMAFLTIEDLYGGMTALVFPKTLEQYDSLLKDGAVLELSGKLSFSEDKEPELLCDAVAVPNPNRELPPPPDLSLPEGLTITVPSKTDPTYAKALRYIDIFDDGASPLHIRFADSGRLLKAPPRFHVAVNPTLLSALRDLLGRENVSFR